MHRPSFTLMGFLAMAFLVVGMIGLFATYAAPAPLERALRREAALDDALAAARGPDPAAALAALAPRLDDSAERITPPGAATDAAAVVARIAAERVAMRTRMQAEAAEIEARLRLMIGVVTLMAAAFGVALLHTARRERSGPA